VRRRLCLDRLLEAHHGEELATDSQWLESGWQPQRAGTGGERLGTVLGYRKEIMWMKVTQSREVGEEEEEV